MKRIKQSIFPLGALWLSTGFLIAQASAENNGPVTVNVSGAVSTTAGGPRSSTMVTSRPGPIKVSDDMVVDFFQKNEPDVYKQLMVLKDKDKGKYDSMVRDFKGEVGRLLDLQRRNEALFNITMEDRRIGFESLQLSRAIREGKLSPQDLEKSTSQLQDLVEQQFEVRQKIRQVVLDEQKARIENLKRNLEEIQKNYDNLLAQFSYREKSREDLVKQRMADLLKKNPKVEW